MNHQTMMKTMNESTLNILLENVPFPMVVFDKHEILLSNRKCHDLLSEREFNISLPDLFHLFRGATIPTKNEIVLLDRQLNKHWFEMTGELIQYRNSTVVMAFMMDVTSQNNTQRDADRVTKLYELMLEVNHSIVDIGDLQRTYNLILTNALKAIKNSSLGSIMIKKNGFLESIAYIGYGKDIESFHLPVEHSFIYRSTEGKMDRICNVPDLQRDDLFYSITTYAGDLVYIRSHLTAPIYIKDEFYGMISLDSIHPNAFDDTDVATMEFIRKNVQIAIANQLLFIEKSQMAMFDQLTGLYNRHYFNEQFESIKSKALRFKESFLFVLFDIDDLKMINDRFGHYVGDQAILKITDLLLKNTRKSDIIARYGGDEFVGIFFGTTIQDLKDKYEHMDELMFADPIFSSGRELHASFSFGIAEFPLDGENINDLMVTSDIRMYANKKNKTKNIHKVL
jgi:diguanylate cyclase (GGDEF)-like protein